jgi:hypothetical protein
MQRIAKPHQNSMGSSLERHRIRIAQHKPPSGRLFYCPRGMTINQTTLLLDQSAWDLVLDSNGNWAIANAPYSIAQDVASAVRTFKSECWYDVSQGLPYWQNILGQRPPLSFIRQQIINAAMTVPNVAQVKVTFDGFSNRQLTGQIQIIDTDGVASNVSFPS